MDQANKDILKLVGRYRVATRQTIGSVLPADTEPDKRLKRLVVTGLLRAHKGFSGNRTLYQVTRKGAAAVGLSDARARKFGGQALTKHLGILHFCHTEGTERYRVEDGELHEVLGKDLPDAAHCLCKVRDEVVILNCYVPGPLTPIVTVVRHLRKIVDEAMAIASLRNFIDDLRYGFAILVDTPERKKAVMDALRTEDRHSGPPLIKLARFTVEVVPELGTMLRTNAQGLGDVRTGDED